MSGVCEVTDCGFCLALTPSDIAKLFKPILEQANSIVEESRKLCGLDVNDLALPVVTVSVPFGFMN